MSMTYKNIIIFIVCLSVVGIWGLLGWIGLFTVIGGFKQ